MVSSLFAEERPFIFYTDSIEPYTVQTKSGKKKYYIRGHITSGDLDLVKDIVTMDCMWSINNQFKTRNIKLDFEHESMRGKSDLEAELNKTRIPLGKSASDVVDDTGNLVLFELNPLWKKFDEKGNVTMTFGDVWQTVNSGFLDSFSIAYIATKTVERKMKDGNTARLLNDVVLLNVALTGNPINPNATMTAVMAKSIEYMKNREEKTMTEKDKPPEGTQPPKDGDASGTGQDAGTNSPLGGTPPAAGTLPAEGTSPKDGEETGEGEAEKKGLDELNKEFVEVKSTLETMKTELKAIVEENKELKGIVEKSRLKAVSEGAESKTKLEELKAAGQKRGIIDRIK